MNLNKVMLSGNLATTPDLTVTPSGMSILNFAIAVNRGVKGQDGNWTNIASFFDCAVYGAFAETMANKLVKGQHVSILGHLVQSRWKGSDGKNHSRVSVVVESIDSYKATKEETQEPTPQLDEYIPF